MVVITIKYLKTCNYLFFIKYYVIFYLPCIITGGSGWVVSASRVQSQCLVCLCLIILEIDVVVLVTKFKVLFTFFVIDKNALKTDKLKRFIFLKIIKNRQPYILMIKLFINNKNKIKIRHIIIRSTSVNSVLTSKVL